MENIINVSQDEFESKLNEFKDKKILVDFWAPWCGPCVALTPILNSLAEENADDFTILKVNVDENQELAAKHKIMSIPTMMFFKNEKPVDVIVGVKQKNFLQDKISSL